MLIFRWRGLMLFLGDAVLFYAALAAALVLRRFGLVPFAFYVEHVKVFSLFLPVWVCVFYVVGFYDIRLINKLVSLINSALIAFAVNLSVSAAAFYLFSIELGITPKTHLLLTLALFHIAAPLWRRVWTRASLSKFLAQRVAFLGGGVLIEEIKNDLRSTPQLGFVVTPLPELGVNDAPREGFWRFRGMRGGELAARIDLLVANAGDSENDPVVDSPAFSAAVIQGIPIVSHLDFYEDLYGKIPPEYAARPGWLLSNVLRKRSNIYPGIKRGLDVALAFSGLLLGAPFMAAVYCALRITGSDGAPAFFFQKRVGYLGRRFIIWKFRTMVRGADKAGPLYQSRAEDARVTRLGRFLRKTRLDELPQLWNVLKGDMSLVGPRPEWTREVSLLERAVPHYHLRHLVKPGLTGWAQIHLQATSSEAESLEKLHYDLYYVKNVSLALDIGIILRTFRRIFQEDTSFLADPIRP